MTKHLIRLSLSAFLLGLAVIPFALPARASHITTSYHKNTMWASAQVSQSWHGVNEDAIDLRDPDCSQNNQGNCNTVYFRHQGLNQFAVEYTLTDYSITTT